MSDPRIRRIKEDLEGVQELHRQSDGMLDFSVSPDLEHYWVTVRGVPGLEGTTERHRVARDAFSFDISFPPEYSNLSPIVTFERPIFHPNCWRWGVLCFEWTPSTTLRDLIIFVVKIINYQIVNLRSVANTEAGEWYERNAGRIEDIIQMRQFPPDLNSQLIICETASDDLVILGERRF